MIGAKRLEKVPKSRAMVGIFEMAHLMCDHVVDTRRRRPHEFGIQQDRPVRTRASPAFRHDTDPQRRNWKPSVRAPFLPTFQSFLKLHGGASAIPLFQNPLYLLVGSASDGYIEKSPTQHEAGRCSDLNPQPVLPAQIPMGGSCHIAPGSFFGLPFAESASLLCDPKVPFFNPAQDFRLTRIQGRYEFQRAVGEDANRQGSSVGARESGSPGQCVDKHCLRHHQFDESRFAERLQ